jgi:hypothetical protein
MMIFVFLGFLITTFFAEASIVVNISEIKENIILKCFLVKDIMKHIWHVILSIITIFVDIILLIISYKMLNIAPILFIVGYLIIHWLFYLYTEYGNKEIIKW